MHRTTTARLLALLTALVLVASACSNREDTASSTDDAEDTTADTGGGDGEDGDEGDTGDDEGDTDEGDDGGSASEIDTSNCATDPTEEIEGDTIKLVSSFPQSGLTAAFAQISMGWKAYFEYMNEQGGVEIAGNKYTVETEDKDDEYNPSTTAANIDELVGVDGDRAFAVFNVVGTANNITIRDTLEELCVPNLFAATGSPAWGSPDYLWTTSSTLAPYTLEGKAFAEYLEENSPQAKVAMLVQDDDFGRAYEQSFKRSIEGTDIEVVAVEKYATGAAEVGAQITSLAAKNADAFFNGGTLLACPDALTKAKQANWEPITWVSGTCISKTLMGIATANNAGDGVLSLTNIMDPLNPAFDDHEAMQLYREEVPKYSPDADLDNGIVAYGWTQAAVLVEAMKGAESPSRLGVLEAVRNMEVSEVGLLIDGVTLTTSGTDDPYMGETVQVVEYNMAEGYFDDVGDLSDYEGQTTELTPEALITG
jgi:branched-chain amino acid transport system substrate-binding protein